MIVTATEFKTNIGKYLVMADGEDVLVTKNGRGVAKLVSVREGNKTALHSLRGILKSGSHDFNTDLTRESIRDERLGRKYEDAD